MDVDWFKKQQKIKDVTADKIAAEMGRARSAVSRIYSGEQKMSLDWARAFARALDLSLDEVLSHAGVLGEQDAKTVTPSLSDGDASPYKVHGDASNHRQLQIIEAMGGGRSGVEIWQVREPSLAFMGYMPGDAIAVDAHQSELTKAGDVVLAQIYEHSGGRARTILRRHEPPVLVAASPNPDDARTYVVDHNNVVIRGKVIASWRLQ
ncbi:helix-turn-helix domain-containing protein [Palleronia pelagia]|uniref:SOS-response transcriptional repressor LexA (RecA-mediated autopeptidase) n=1 Tax=Palleronia pelagia TaxID=387096 RepID=A0A1H8HXG4_9RHOB|nr:helix-turn-helix transcriptional regulator [Palleronia pelagia]SEN60929.1 hypothetical protein SAMN04488011_10538 [Palleronia pelagia]